MRLLGSQAFATAAGAVLLVALPGCDGGASVSQTGVTESAGVSPPSATPALSGFLGSECRQAKTIWSTFQQGYAAATSDPARGLVAATAAKDFARLAVDIANDARVQVTAAPGLGTSDDAMLSKVSAVRDDFETMTTDIVYRGDAAGAASIAAGALQTDQAALWGACGM